MDNSNQAKTTLAVAISWTALMVACACLCFLAWYIPADRRMYARLFNDFEVELPRSTQFVLAIPDAAFPAVAFLFGITVLVVQWRVREKHIAAVFHMFVIAFCCLAFVAYRESLLHPIAALISALNGGVPGGG